MTVAERRLWVLRRVIEVDKVRGRSALVPDAGVRAFHVRFFFAREDGDPDASIDTFAGDLRWLTGRGLLRRTHPQRAEYLPTDAGVEAAEAGALPS